MQVTFAVRTALVAIALAMVPAEGRADAREQNCAIEWSGLKGSRDQAVLRAFAKKCSGTPAGNAAAQRIVVRKPPPPPPPPPTPLTARQFLDRGLVAQRGGRLEAARRDFSTACYRGLGEACTTLGISYAIPMRGAPSYPDARIAYREGCRQNETNSCMGLVSYTSPNSQGGYIATDYRYGLDQLCRLGRADYCNTLGRSYTLTADGWDPALAINAYRRGCALGSALSCDFLRIVRSADYFKSIDLSDAQVAFDKAIAINPGLVPLCSSDFANACAALAGRYATAPATQQDSNNRVGLKVYRLARGACDGGVTAQCERAALFSTYNPTPVPGERRTLYAKACNAPNATASACYWYGTSLQSVSDGPTSPDSARAQYQKACSKGMSMACPLAAPPKIVPYVAPR